LGKRGPLGPICRSGSPCYTLARLSSALGFKIVHQAGLSVRSTALRLIANRRPMGPHGCRSLAAERRSGIASRGSVPVFDFSQTGVTTGGRHGLISPLGGPCPRSGSRGLARPVCHAPLAAWVGRAPGARSGLCGLLAASELGGLASPSDCATSGLGPPPMGCLHVPIRDNPAFLRRGVSRLRADFHALPNAHVLAPYLEHHPHGPRNASMGMGPCACVSWALQSSAAPLAGPYAATPWSGPWSDRHNQVPRLCSRTTVGPWPIGLAPSRGLCAVPPPMATRPRVGRHRAVGARLLFTLSVLALCRVRDNSRGAKV